MTDGIHFALYQRDFDKAKSMCQQLVDYWRTLYIDDKKIPSLRGFNPMRLVSSLDHIYMLEQENDLTISVRHRGTAIENSTDKYFQIGDHLNAYTPAEYKQFSRYFDALFEGPNICMSEWRYFTPDYEVFDAVSYSLPMWCRQRQKRIALGILVVRKNFHPDVKDECKGTLSSSVLNIKYESV